MRREGKEEIEKMLVGISLTPSVFHVQNRSCVVRSRENRMSSALIIANTPHN